MTAGRVQTEDVLTEVVAHLFRVDADARGDDLDGSLVVSWLREIGAATGGGVSGVVIETQRAFAALSAAPGRPAHAKDSRPDVLITLMRGVQPERVLVEPKVGSGEGERPLLRYADHLEAIGGGTLIYLTRDYDPKIKSVLLAGRNAVDFVPARWYEAARFISCARASAPVATHCLYDDTLSFLAALDMSLAPRFTPADALALSRISQTAAFLDATLWEGDQAHEAPSARFHRLTGGAGHYQSVSLARMREHGHYALRRQLGGPQGYVEVLLGYRLGEDAMPWLTLSVGSQADAHEPGIRALGERDWWSVKGDGWTSARFTQAFVPTGDDHAAGARSTFHEMLRELKAVMKLTADALPWGDLVKRYGRFRRVAAVLDGGRGAFP